MFLDKSGNIKATASDLESLYNQTIHALVFAGVNHGSTHKKIYAKHWWDEQLNSVKEISLAKHKTWA